MTSDASGANGQPAMPAPTPPPISAFPPPTSPPMLAPGPGPVVAPIVRKQGAWGLWWLCVITLGIYYYVWYHRINKELASVSRAAVPANGNWWNQLIPIWNLVGLGATAKRLNAAHAGIGSPTRVGLFVTWFWGPLWFASQTRYLQRRLNILHDVLASHSIGRSA
jgi:signal transduction histidine kinase